MLKFIFYIVPYGGCAFPSALLYLKKTIWYCFCGKHRLIHIRRKTFRIRAYYYLCFTALQPYFSIAPPIHTRNCANYFTAAAFFADTPFLAVPPNRLGNIIRAMERPHPRGGLLGGSSTGKPSKLAALAASRKKAAEEKKKATSTSAPAFPSGTVTDEEAKGAERISSVALLEKLRIGKARKGSEEQAENPAETRKTIVSEQRKKRNYPTREMPPEDESPLEPAPVTEGHIAETPEQPRENAEELIAQPSSFAETLFAPPISSRSENHESAEMADTSLRLFTLPYPTSTEKDTTTRKSKSTANVDPFSGPSPDDVVLQAQLKGSKPKG